MEVTLIDSMGSDLTVVNAARVSFNKESEWENITPAGPVENVLTEKDERLINYLAKHNHWTPFGHCFIQFRIKAPVFVARQLVKHQIGLVWNEVSRRNVDDKPEFFIPDVWRKRAKNKKQGSTEDGSIHYNTAPLMKFVTECYSNMIKEGTKIFLELDKEKGPSSTTNSLNQIIKDVLNVNHDIENITPSNTNNWDSLTHLNLIIALEEEFKIEIPAEDFTLLFIDYKSIISYLKQKSKINVQN